MFREGILAHLTPQSCVLDLGAGAGIVRQIDFRGGAGRICGVDMDPRVVENPLLDEGRVADTDSIPYEGEMFDVVFSDNVLEHLDTPLDVFREVARALKPGGISLFKTPNRRHYMPTIAQLTPHRFHKRLNRLRGREAVDTFPTRYRANTRGDVRHLALAAGMEVVQMELIEGRPEYLRMSWPTYLIGATYERLVNSVNWLAPFRISLIGQVRKLNDPRQSRGLIG